MNLFLSLRRSGVNRNARLIIAFVVLFAFAAISPVHGEGSGDDGISSEIAALNGLWVGSGSILTSSSQYVGCPTGWDIPIAFYVEDGIARSMFSEKQAAFETKIKKGGKIKFIYEDIGYVDRGAGGRDPLSLRFSGKLEGSSGSGLIRYGRCKGKWEVEKRN